MTGGDLCASVYCSDLALPGQDLCAGCLADRQVEREAIVELAQLLTEQHEAKVTEQEQTG